MKSRLRFLICIVLLLEFSFIEFSDGAEVTGISPSVGSLNGGTRVTIHGSGFAESQFNYGAGNENLGSQVEMYSGTHKYVCDIHVDGCTKNLITCYTRPMPAGDYNIRIKVDGDAIPDANHCSSDATKCIYKLDGFTVSNATFGDGDEHSPGTEIRSSENETKSWNTPTIERIEPTSGPPGTFVTMYGRIITTRFGSNLLPADGTGEQSNKLLRVYHNGQTCEVKDTSTDTFYGIGLDDPDSNLGYGHLKCKMSGTYVATQNFSFLVENEYGRSNPTLSLLLLSANEKIGMFQTYAGIQSVSPTSGSTSGGTVLTITGVNFDQTDSPIKVKVGGEDCAVFNMTSTEILCTTPSQPTSKTSYPGNRGLLREIWSTTASTYSNVADILNLTNSAADYSSSIIDNSSFLEDIYTNNVNRLTGYFIPSKTASYRFYIKSDDFASLYFSATGQPVDQIEIASCPSYTSSYSTHSEQSSRSFDLVAGQAYYMTVLHGNYLNASSVKVAARSNTSVVTANMSGTGRDEKQELIVNSTVIYEKQSISISNWDSSSNSFTAEKQTVTIEGITGPNEDAMFRLGLYGVYTAPISVKATAKEVQTALNNLATYSPDTVTVGQSSPSATSEKFEIEFNSDRGNLPDLTYMVEPSTSTLSISVSEKKRGVSGKGKAYIEIDGVISPGISQGATANEVKSALDSVFGVRCPPVIVKPEDGAYGFLEDYESSGSSYLDSEESFCGRNSVKNPNYIYKTATKSLGVKIGTYRTLCFGYKGEINRLKITHDYSRAERRYTEYMNLDLKPAVDKWNYTCIDIGTHLVNKNNQKTGHRVWQIIVQSDSADEDFYIDTVALLISEKASSDIGEGVLNQIYRAAKPGGQPIKEYTVTGSGPYEITMAPYKCGNNFDKFKITDAQTTVSMSTTQVTKASKPITGSFDVSFNTQAVSIPVTSTDKEVQTLLETTFIDSIGSVHVDHQGDCANFAYIVTFVTNRGDQQEMTVSSSGLSGESPMASVNTARNGGAIYDPIPGDMLRTAHSKPQVLVYVNGIPTKCDGTCDFEWTTSSTPVMTSASQTQGTQALGTVLVITGSGFSSVASENTVTIGGVECTVTGATTTSVTCNVGNGPMGQYNIIILVEGKGQASGSLQFEYTADITGINPTSGSTGGGTLLTISGSGFATDAVVQVGGVDCTVQDSQPGQVTCLTPRSTASTVDVTVQQNGNILTSGTQFTYDSAITPTISSLSQTTASVFGGETITITGSGFGGSATSADAVKINGAAATITSYSDTSIVVVLPPNPPGVYSVDVTVGTNGFADAGNGGKITYSLVVKDIYPPRGSLYGDTLVTIFGEGFGTNVSLVTASFGTFKCEIQTITNTELTCLTSSTAKTHVITNQGSHQTYGQGFAWDPITTTVVVGDTINWQWTASASRYQFCINQTENITAKETKQNGFSSGPQTSSGSYMYQPTAASTITYWSGFVDGVARSISLSGRVTVTDRSDSVHSLMLKVNGYEAEHDVSTKGTMTPTNTGSCTWDVTPITSCSTLSGDATKHSYSYQDCSTGTVTSISSNQASGAENIVLIGQGFSTTSCRNEIKLGDYRCVVSSATSTKATCTVDAQQAMQVGDLEYYDVRNSNRGGFLIALPTKAEKAFYLLPHISTISPEKGSIEGGITLTITGGGFIPSSTSVSVGFYDCPVVSVDYTTITCTLPRSAKQENKEVKVSVTKNGQTVQAKCSTTSQVCSYLYDAASTPTVTQVSPDTIPGSSSTSLTITGTLFGTVTSDVTVNIAGETCSVSSVTATSISCTITSSPVGEHNVVVMVSNLGRATPTVKVNSPDTLTSVTPSSGSTQGKTVITIQGNGFVFNKTTVQIDGNECDIISTTLTVIECSTPAGAGSATITVKSNGVTYQSTLTFTYDMASTPTVTNISPSSGKAGDTIAITGTMFSSTQSNDIVKIDGATCTVTSATSTSIQCTLGAKSPGQYDVSVDIVSLGRASSSSQFTYSVAAAAISPVKGSLGGGQDVTVTGTGFGPTTSKVTICGETCTVDDTTSTSTQLVCSTPPSTGTTTVDCDVVISDNGQTSTLTAAYQYDAAMSPSITEVSPAFGGTSGGTTLTITGSGFGTVQSAVTVKIGGIDCVLQSVTDTQVVCVTGARNSGSIDTKVELQINGGGNAQQIGADFSYMYAWSSTNSWGGNNPPGVGEIVVIPKGMTILLDQSTPTLKMLLIQGGKVIFDEQNLELQSEYILITDGGALQVGTEDKPFQSEATITLHGFYRSQELPVYGSKVLAVREGTLDLHGKVTPYTWTHLANTANAGDTSITLMHSVNWEVGNMIVIPTTGHRHSQSETETRTITAITPDGLTLTLDSALQYKHVAVTETFGSTSVELRGEVGLLSHNVKVRGSSDDQWSDKIPKCEEGFDTGEFVTQTCFQGRFGEESGSDQFGSQILIHAPRPNENLVTARISYTEVTHAGQAFRLGRYPIHFHLNGNMSSSYVRGCGIHNTFNRAINVHGTHNVLIEHTVIYKIMGGAFFLEDGVETENIFQYNLGVAVMASTSLLNDDITPATFWVTNPNNIIQHNAAVGGTHFGYWYRMHDHPDGPSFDPNICPKHVPLGVFQNNTAHSFGWFGLWIFHDYTPREDGSCDSTSAFKVAVFQSMTVWNCEKGAEGVNIGTVQFDGFVLVNNEKAGYEGKLVIETNPYDVNEGYAVKNSIMVGRSQYLEKQPGWPSSGSGCTVGGIVLPYGSGFMVSGVKFYNFDEATCQAFTFTKIDGTCSNLCGGFNYKFQNIVYDTPTQSRRVKFEWFHQGVLIDVDGTFSGKPAGTSIIPTMPTQPPECTTITSGFDILKPASSCQPSVKFHRMSFNNISPPSLKGKDALITNQYGTVRSYYAFHRVTHGEGWVAILQQGTVNKLEFENADQVTNISYSAIFYEFYNQPDHIEICQSLEQQPDRFYFDNSNDGVAMSTAALDINNNKNGDWYFNNVSNDMCYMVAGKLNRKRGAGLRLNEVDRKMNVNSYKCYFTNCTAPPDPDTVPPTCTRASDAVLYSDTSIWDVDSDGYVSNVGTGTSGLPQTGQKVKIMKDTWVVVDTDIPQLEYLILEGTFELDHGPSQDREFTIDVMYLYILGGRLIIGCQESSPFLGTASIILRGDHSTPAWPRTEGPNIGAKAIGVFGGLDLHGRDVSVTWTRLAQTATAGSNQIVLTQQVNWAAGDEIVITATGYNVNEVETKTIQSIASDKITITLADNLSYKHIASSETLSNGQSYSLSAEVGLLTRNIKIIGEEYSKMDEESFGARVLIGLTADTTRSYTGYARVSNVEFKNTGQDGFTASYDPRYSISYLEIGDVSGPTAVKPCYVKKCSFHHGYGTAIGVFGTHGLEIQDNVVHRTVGPSIQTRSVSTRIRRNLLVLSYWPGAYQDRKERDNLAYHGSISAVAATELVLQGNAISSSDRAGYHGAPEDCVSSAEPWMDNTIHSSLVGVAIFPTDAADDPDFNSQDRCVQYANFTIWKCYDYGIYYNSMFDVEIRQNTLVDNGVSIFPMIFGPSAVAHQFRNHYVKVEDSLVVGQSNSFDCTTDVIDTTDDNIKLSRYGASWRIDGTGKIGLSTGCFVQGSNSATDKPLAATMSYNAIGGRMEVKGVTFANFQSTCSGGKDFAMTTNPNMDDAIHPVLISSSTLINVGSEHNLFMHRPNVGKINPSDCVDMDCDGLKKALVKDADGTFLGMTGDAFSQSEYEWDGDPRRGLGDYRIPKNMVTYPDGSRQPYDVVAKYKGIIRDSTCTYKSYAQAWFCSGYNYEQVIIENMDADTETRRLSPVGVLGWDDNDNGYIDLINGPQDHGWCSGYTCQKRLSTFTAVMATGRNYSLYFTSTSPQYTRYRMLNSNNTKSVGIATYYNTPNRLDVYCDGVYVLPNNGEYDSDKKILLKASTTWDQYIPNPVTGACGENYLDYDWKHQHIIVRGSGVVDVKIVPVIVLGFNVPSMTVDQFFGPNLVNNLALFLGVSAGKVRVMNVITGVDRRRKKRSTGPNTMYYVEVGNQPCSDINCTVSTVNTMTFNDLQLLAVSIINSYQAGNLSDILNITINGLSVAEAMPPVTDPTWAQVVEAGDDYISVLKVPHTFHIKEEPQPASEGNPFTVQPKLHMLDILGAQITLLGASIAPWKVSVSLKAGSGSNSLAELTGTKNVSFVDGWANFTDIGISHEGSGYILEFTVSYPDEVVFTVDSSPLVVTQRGLKAGLVSKTSDVQQNQGMTVILDIKDSNTNAAVPDINWKGHLWQVSATMSSPLSFGYGGSLSGTTVGTFDPANGQVTLNDLRFDQSGMAVIKFTVTSIPAGYQFEVDEFVEVISSEYATVTEDTTKEMKIKVDQDFSTYGTTEFGAAVVNSMMTSKNAYIRAKNMVLSQGSVIITTTITGNTTTVQQIIDDVCDSISTGTTLTYNGQTFTLSSYLTIDNVTYYGVSCGASTDDDKAKTGMIVGLVICVIIILALVGGILYWRFIVYPKTKTHRIRRASHEELEKDPRYVRKNGKSYEDILWREDTFQSLRQHSWIPEKIMPPMNTTFSPNSKEGFTGHQ